MRPSTPTNSDGAASEGDIDVDDFTLGDGYNLEPGTTSNRSGTATFDAFDNELALKCEASELWTFSSRTCSPSGDRCGIVVINAKDGKRATNVFYETRTSGHPEA